MRKEEILLALVLALFTFVIPFATAAKAPVFEGLESEITACESSVFEYEFTASDADGDIVNVDIQPKGPFFIDSSNETPTKITIFSEKLTQTHANKDYEVTIFIFDEFYAESKDVTIRVEEVNNPPILGNSEVKTE